jgi:small-conductance mechanosensitive channel
MSLLTAFGSMLPSQEQQPTPDSEVVSSFIADMGFAETAEVVHTILNYPLFPVGDQQVTATTILIVGILIVLTWWISHVLQRALDRTFRARGVSDPGTTAITKRLLHYAVMAIGLSIAITEVGINLSALFAAGALFAVGIGFAMQNIAQNFVSGLILLVERAIKPGDVVEVEGRVVRVLKMGIRTTIARTRDEEELIIPNASLVQSTVKNFTLDDPLFRVRASVGVSYDSDMRKVRDSLTRAATSIEERETTRTPVILLTDFGDSTVDWQVSIWSTDAWTSPRLASALREAIWWAFKEDDIEIAFHQIDLHLDPPLEEAFTRLSKAG